MAQRNPDRYPLRVQLAGMLYWTCPNCGKLNKTRMSAGKWAVQCAEVSCGRVCILGVHFYSPRPGQRPDRPGDPPDGQITDTPPTDHTNALSDPTNNDPMPIATARGARKAYTPVHSTDPIPD